MPTFKITKNDGAVIEISDLSFAEIKELVSANGHNGASAKTISRAQAQPSQPNYLLLAAKLTEKARKFFHILRANPNGINSDRLAEQLGFHSGSQLGGMAGGGIAKTAARCGIGVERLYTTEAKFGPNGRVVTYYAGPDAQKVL